MIRSLLSDFLSNRVYSGQRILSIVHGKGKETSFPETFLEIKKLRQLQYGECNHRGPPGRVKQTLPSSHSPGVSDLIRSLPPFHGTDRKSDSSS